MTNMTNKQRILQMVQRWPDDIPFEKALYHLSVLKAIDEGLKDIEAGRTRDFDEVFDELERECGEESQTANVRSRRKRPRSATKEDRRAGRAKNGEIIRKPTEKVRKRST